MIAGDSVDLNFSACSAVDKVRELFATLRLAEMSVERIRLNANKQFNSMRTLMLAHLPPITDRRETSSLENCLFAHLRPRLVRFRTLTIRL